MINVMLTMSGILFFYFIYLQEQYFWSSIQNKFCKKFCGHCEDCTCWSCYRKDYIDEYKNQISIKYKIYEEEKKIKRSLNQ